MEISAFKNKRINYQKLLQYGFFKTKNGYEYKTDIADGQFRLFIFIDKNENIKTELTELETGELYTLHLVKNADGNFVGKIRDEYEKVLNDISQKCFDISIFKSKYTYSVLDYAKEKYGDNPEYLWEKFPENAIIRRKDTKKWYGAILTVKKNKFGFKGEETVEVIDLHATADDVKYLIKQENIYPGYHMNKKYWFTIILDGSVSLDKIYELIDNSYNLAKK